MEKTVIRNITEADWPAVRRIYEQGIATGNATFETQAPAWKEWDEKMLPFCRLLAEQQEEILGWAALNPYSSRAVYRGVAEVSIYVGIGYHGRGIGKLLLAELIRQSEVHGIWTLQAGIFPENRASMRLHERAGFRTVGARERIGRQHGVWRDVVLMERRSGVVG